MQILNIAGYKFTSINDVSRLREVLLVAGKKNDIKGTILLSEEGINLNLAGSIEKITAFRQALISDARFSDMKFHESYSEVVPFKRFKVKLKKEIITMRQPEAMPAEFGRGPDIAPEMLKQWLDEGRDFTLLDTRNDFECQYGTFKGAVNPGINNFGELASAVEDMDHDKPVVMFCTGGIRCEKASLYMLKHGFKEVYQLDGGILGYFAKVGGDYYEGDCFVFDDRVALDANLRPAK